MLNYPYRHVPKTVLVVKSERLISATALTDRQRRALWEGIKALDPKLAQLITQDPDYQAMKSQWSGQIQITPAQLNRFTAAGLKIIEEN